jgi:DNA-directed RNA polymerase subunit RPC12/RpoP
MRFFGVLQRFIKENGRKLSMVVMKKLCSECKARFEVSLDDLEEGDAVACSECNLEYTVVADKKGNFKLIESKEFEMEEEEEESSSGSDEEDFDSD